MRTYKTIELFAGCGGLALGLHNAGIEPVLLVEKDKDCAATLKANMPRWIVAREDVQAVSFHEYLGVDIVSGGFPCQPFSVAGKGLGFAEDRGSLFFQILRCLKEARPRVALLENVKGLVSHDKGTTLRLILDSLKEIGYTTQFKVLNSKYFGVSQKRERLFILAVRNDVAIAPIFPEESDKIIPLKEALEGCPISPGAKYSAKKESVLKLVPAGKNWKSLPVDIQKDYMKRAFYQGGGKTGVARRLSWDEPSLTLTCSPSQTQTERCHPEETRPLTVREYARIQTFPDSWTFCGSVASQYRQIGNAVPVRLAEAIGRSLIAMLDSQITKNNGVNQ